MFFSPFRKLCFVNLGILIYILDSSNSYAQELRFSGSVVAGQADNLFPHFNELNEFNHQNLCDRGWNSSFTLNGRGGVPQTPKQDLSPEAVQIGLVEAVPIEQKNATENSNQIIASQSLTNLQQPIEKTVSPAQGWIYNNKGEVALVAYNPTLTAQQRLQQHAVCSANK